MNFPFFSFHFSFAREQKATNHKHCILFKASRHGIERLEICDKEDDKNPKIITLENCVKITQEASQANQITIVTKTGTLTLNALNETELKLWVQALQNVAFKDKSATLMRNSMMEEDNDLYCSSYSDGIFPVKLLATDIPHTQCNLEAKAYMLHLTTTEIQLKSVESNAIVAKWPYRYVRKYGYRDGKFTFEAGRKCDTGEGVFSWQHSNPQEVFRCMAAKMKSMKKLISGDALDCGEHQLNAALCMEPGSRSPLPPAQHQSHHSDTDLNQSGHLIRDFLSSNDSLNNVHMATAMASPTTPTAPALKHIPSKPPRKSLPTIDASDKSSKNSIELPSPKLNRRKFTKYQDYEPVSVADAKKSTTTLMKTPPPLPTSPIPSGNSSKSLSKISELFAVASSSSPIIDHPPQLPVRNESMNLDDRNYERIENISNAWRTLGVSDVNHTENLKPNENDLIEFVWQRSQSQKSKKSRPLNVLNDFDTLTSSPTPKPSSTDDGNYDKLEFFATKNNASNDYRTIVSINSQSSYKKQTSQPVTSNDYEIIGDCMTAEPKPYRLADDSYMGYGILRKPTNASAVDAYHAATTTSSTSVSHHQQQATSGTSTADDDLLNHWNHNGKDYAVVSKPKNV